VAKPKSEVSQTSRNITRRTGSGGERGAGSGSAPTISSVSSSGNITGRSSTIQAVVQGKGAGLSKSDIRLYLDEAEQTRFNYRRVSGRLSCSTGILSPGTHTVEIVATADQGRSTARKSWTFTVR
jgi:hypothetical protein